MTISYSEDAKTKTAEIVVNGKVSRTEFDEILPKMRTFIESCGSVRFIEIIEKMEFPYFDDPTMFWDGLKFDAYAIPKISHVAVVSDIGWLSPLSKAAGAMMSTKLRTFKMAELDEAREWIKSAD